MVYRQLKHSTVRATEEWSVSGLSKTVKGFAEKFRQIRQESPGLEEKVTFEFLSNRPVRESVLRAIGNLIDEPGHVASRSSSGKTGWQAPLSGVRRAVGSTVASTVEATRQANAALHRVVKTCPRFDTRTQGYYERRIRESKSRREIVRCLKRYAAREVFRRIRPTQSCPLS